GHNIYAALDFTSLATSRAHSMDSRAAGLTVRFFNLIIATGQGFCRNLIGRAFMELRFAPSRSTEIGIIVRKWPVGLAEVGATGGARSMDGLATTIGGRAAQDKSPQT